MIIKKGNELPDNPMGSLTLEPNYIGTHENGWTITGKIKEDYYEWVNEFHAIKNGKIVFGDFESQVYASDEETYQEFIKEFPPHAWDYGDI